MMISRQLIRTGLLVFLSAFLVFALTSAPDLMFTDSGELASACVTLGVAHPTGYPLFTILGHIWSRIPLPFSAIYSLNLFNALCASAGVALFFGMTFSVFRWLEHRPQPHKNWDKKPPKNNKRKQESHPDESVNHRQEPLSDTTLLIISAATALLLAFGRTVWAQATSLEVHALQFALLTLMLGLFLHAMTDKEQIILPYFLWAFALGLCFTNHLTTVTTLPALAYLYFKRPEKTWDFSADRLRFIFALLVPFAVALTLYAVLPLRSASAPEFNWGDVSRGFDKFWYHVSGKQFRVWLSFFESGVWNKQLGVFLRDIPLQFGFIGLLPTLWGIFRLFRKNTELAIFFLLLAFGNIAYVINYSIHDIDSYFLIALIALTFFCGYGLADIIRKAPKYAPIALCFPIFSLALNWKENNLSHNRLVPEFTRILSDNLKPNAIVISSQWDIFCSAFWYKQRIEGYRRDVVLLEKELMRRTWYLPNFRQWYPETANTIQPEIDAFLQNLTLFEADAPYNPAEIQRTFVAVMNGLIDKNYGKRPIYLTLDILQNEKDVAVGYKKIPEGFAFRLEKSDDVQKISVDNMDLSKIVASEAKQSEHLEEHLVKVATANLMEAAKYAAQSGQNDALKRIAEKILQLDPKNPQATQILQMSR